MICLMDLLPFMILLWYHNSWTVTKDSIVTVAEQHCSRSANDDLLMSLYPESTSTYITCPTREHEDILDHRLQTVKSENRREQKRRYGCSRAMLRLYLKIRKGRGVLNA